MPIEQQKLVLKGGKVADDHSTLTACGVHVSEHSEIGSIAMAKAVLLGTANYHKVQSETAFLQKSAAELDAMQASLESLAKSAAHGGGANDGGATLRVRHARLADDVAALRNRLETTHWKGQSGEDLESRAALLERLRCVEETVGTVRRHFSKHA